MTKKTKLELTWPGKENRPMLESHILIEDAGKSCHAAARAEGDLFGNILTKGGNLLALRALEGNYAGKFDSDPERHFAAISGSGAILQRDQAASRGTGPVRYRISRRPPL